MSFSIKIPDSAAHSQSINIGASTYNILFKFNTSDQAWYFRLESVDDVALTDDLKVMPNQNITGRFPYSKPLPNGDIWCLRTKNDFSPVGRDNLGVDKTYELIYLTDSEAEELGISDSIQL